MAETRRHCGHEWRNNDFDCLECLSTQLQRYESALVEIRDGSFRYNMGDYETCAKNAARLALGIDAEAPSDFEQLTRLREEISFAISNGHKWTRKDWANWIKNHAEVALQ